MVAKLVGSLDHSSSSHPPLIRHFGFVRSKVLDTISERKRKFNRFAVSGYGSAPSTGSKKPSSSPTSESSSTPSDTTAPTTTDTTEPSAKPERKPSPATKRAKQQQQQRNAIRPKNRDPQKEMLEQHIDQFRQDYEVRSKCAMFCLALLCFALFRVLLRFLTLTTNGGL